MRTALTCSSDRPRRWTLAAAALAAAIISNACGNAVSADDDEARDLYIVRAFPAGMTTVIDGETATFTEFVRSYKSYTVQWMKNGSDIPGATEPSVSTPEGKRHEYTAILSYADSGARFRMRAVTVDGYAVESAEVAVRVLARRVTITEALPSTVTAAAGSTVTLSIGIGPATQPIAFQWLRNGTPIEGATAASYTTPPLTAADHGAQFQVTVSNLVGPVSSNVTTLSVQP